MEKDNKAKNIVVVDDTESISHALKELLIGDGYNVTTFNDPKKAIEEIKKNGSPGFIITDYRMPEMTGVEMLNEVEKLDPKIKALIMSADPYEVKQVTKKYEVIEKASSFIDKIYKLINKGINIGK